MMLMGCMLAVQAMAVPANPKPMVTTQPDGSQVTLKLCGDEFYSFSTTTDDYTVVKNSAGYWVYAQSNNSRLVPSSVVAHDQGRRTPDEIAFLQSMTRRITDIPSVSQAKKVRSVAQAPNRAFDVSKFRGLIILVEPSDVSFSNNKSFYNTIVNSDNFTGGNLGMGTWTGSVRDYYRDNSVGQFVPEFDIVGPYKTSVQANKFYVNNGYRTAFREALNSAMFDVTFSNYDGDNDGKVDMVFFIVAGYGSNIQNNDPGLLWPHKSNSIGNGWYQDKKIDVYACSTEMGGSQAWGGYVDGIGTICHEFTHVLGFPDLYDANYATDGQGHDPGDWDIMAGGTYHNNARTPSGYSIFERYALGFATPSTIRAEGTYTLDPVNVSNTGYILRTPVNKEYFIIENRQRTKWDAFLPGHGMLVTRVDSTNSYYWVSNQVNNFADHLYYELLRAGNTAYGSLASDPFPGTYCIPNLTNYTMPSLRTYAGKENTYEIVGISEKNGIVTFNVLKAGDAQHDVETFNRFALTTTEATGDMTRWRLAQCSIVDVETGNRGVAMKNPSVLMMTEPVNYNITQVSFDVSNTSGDAAKLTLSYTIDDGATWVNAASSAGQTTTTVPGSAKFVTYWNVMLAETQDVRFRITMNGGNKSVPCVVDNFTIFYSDQAEYAAEVRPSVLEFGNVNVGESKSKSFIITNKGLQPFTPNITGMSSVFTVNYTPAPLRAGKSVTIPVTYTPASATSSSNKVTINCGNAGNHTIYFTGTGIKTSVRGDVNGDGIVDVTDVNMAIDIVLGKASYKAAADLDSNGLVDVSDVNAIIDIVLGK